MGTNYYFRKKGVDLPRLYAIAEELNNKYKSLIDEYNSKVRESLANMGINQYEDYKAFEDRNIYDIEDIKNLCMDIHVGKISHGWKPLLKASEHFDSIETLKQWYAKNKNEYIFINEYYKKVSFDEFLSEIHELNKDPNAKEGSQGKGADGFRWAYGDFL